MSIDRLSGLSGAAAPITATIPDARSIAASAIGEVGHRVLAWVGASTRGGDAGATAWSQATGSTSVFRPDSAELARRGDVYGLNALASDIASQLGGTPTQEGELRRALEDFTRQAVVQVAGLAGASDLQVTGLTQALESAGANLPSTGVDGVVDRLETATRLLTYRNGG